MTEYVVDGWRIEHDPEATARALERAGYRGPEECGCVPCQNFVAVRPEAFPRDFLEVLDELAIKPGSEVEVYHNARLSNGKHSYGGWFHFIGRVVDGPDGVTALDNGFQFGFHSKAHLVGPEISEEPVAELKFWCELPWALETPEVL